MSSVKIVATREPWTRSIMLETMNPDCACASAGTNSRQGMTPMIDRLIAM